MNASDMGTFSVDPEPPGEFRIDPATLGFDIDGVVADTMRLFLDIARDEYGINNIGYEDITCYTLSDCLELAPEVIEGVVERILNGGYRSPLMPIADAPRVLGRVSRTNNPVLFVTARPYQGPIRDWILEELPVEPDGIEVVTTGTYEGKSEILRERGISVFVEDRLETCFDLQRAGITPILFRQPWNRKPHPFQEVGTWKELEALIEFK